MVQIQHQQRMCRHTRIARTTVREDRCGPTALWTQKRSIFARGEGGFGGERGPSTSSEPPEREPDFELSIAVSPQQAPLYRMYGDRNPLHADTEFAAAAGFPRPILHGLCTNGMRCKATVNALLDGDTTRVSSYGARFAGVVFPGETLKASVWKQRRPDSGGDQLPMVRPRTERCLAPASC